MTSWNAYRKGLGAAACTVVLAALVAIGGKSQTGTPATAKAAVQSMPLGDVATDAASASQNPNTAAAKPAEQVTVPSPQELNVGKGLLSDGRGIRINPAAVRSYLTGSASLTYGTIPGNGGCVSQTVPIAGAVIGDKLVIGPPAELLTYSLAMTYAVSAANTVSIRLCNYTSSAIAPPAWTWNVDVEKSF
jgi:hypothetical protein